ncbi:MAG TPA: hypothetical protein VL123_02655 [Candidatus Udaeobacter sp.]|nr:hypothetical protein [Candidatus Udaeobacter sp.]
MEGRRSQDARAARNAAGLIAALAIFWVAAASNAGADDAAEAGSGSKWSAGMESDFASRYEWRGLALSQGAVVQPSVWLSRSGLTLTLWSSVPLESKDPPGFHELDPSIEYERDFAGWTLTPTFEIYTYPGTPGPSSAEVELMVSRSVAGAVSAFARQTIDVAAYSGATSGGYGLKRETDSEAPWSWSGSAHLDWDSGRFIEAYLGVPSRTSQIAEASLAVTRRLGRAYLRGHVQADALLDRELRGTVGSLSPLSGGVAFGAEW